VYRYIEANAAAASERRKMFEEEGEEDMLEMLEGLKTVESEDDADEDDDAEYEVGLMTVCT
jgi:hypothetical protein